MLSLRQVHFCCGHVAYSMLKNRSKHAVCQVQSPEWWGACLVGPPQPYGTEADLSCGRASDQDLLLQAPPVMEGQIELESKLCSCEPRLPRSIWCSSSAPASSICHVQSGAHALLLGALSAMSNLVFALCSCKLRPSRSILCSSSAPASSVHRARSGVHALLMRATFVALQPWLTCQGSPRALMVCCLPLNAAGARAQIWQAWCGHVAVVRTEPCSKHSGSHGIACTRRLCRLNTQSLRLSCRGVLACAWWLSGCNIENVAAVLPWQRCLSMAAMQMD